MIRLRKKYKELNFLVKRKQSIKLSFTIHAQFKRATIMGKRTPKNIIFNTHYFTFNYI